MSDDLLTIAHLIEKFRDGDIIAATALVERLCEKLARERKEHEEEVAGLHRRINALEILNSKQRIIIGKRRKGVE